MADTLRVMLETGPKGKRVVAVAPDWPGLERGARTEEAAVAKLQTYLPRYAPVARLAGMEAEFAALSNVTPTASVEVVERYPGNSSTDFWGISFAFSDFDRQAMSREDLERDLTLLRACWAFFDAVRARVSAEMRKGPRGGGRDRDRIVWHTVGTEQEWAATKLRLRAPEGARDDGRDADGRDADGRDEALLTGEGLRAHRDAYCEAIRAHHAQGKPARSWPLRYLIRHTAFHTLDHTWEMEDKDLTAGCA